MFSDIKSIVVLVIFLTTIITSLIIEKKYKLGEIHYHPVFAISMPILFFSVIAVFAIDLKSIIFALIGVLINIILIVITFFDVKDNFKNSPKVYIKNFFIAPIISLIYICVIIFILSI